MIFDEKLVTKVGTRTKSPDFQPHISIQYFDNNFPSQYKVNSIGNKTFMYKSLLIANVDDFNVFEKLKRQLGRNSFEKS